MLIMNAPITKLVDKMVERRIAGRTEMGGIIPQPINKLANLPIRDIILRYRMILNGIFNYYSFVNNRPRLSTIYWILRKSLAKTLAMKLQLKSSRKVYQKMGINIEHRIRNSNGEEVVLDFKTPSLLPQPKNFLGTSIYKNPFAGIDWKIETINTFNTACSNCGSLQSIQMHHVKHLKTVDVKLDAFGKMMAAINRKQVPLCHVRVHAGKYDGMSLKHYQMERWDDLDK